MHQSPLMFKNSLEASMNNYLSNYFKLFDAAYKKNTAYYVYKARRKEFRMTILELFQPKPLAITITKYWVITNQTRGLQCFDFNLKDRAYGWVLSSTFKVSLLIYSTECMKKHPKTQLNLSP